MGSKSHTVRVDVATAADADRVWAVLTDVADWPSWCRTYVSVRRLDDGPLRLGSSARVKQHGLAPATWTVTELDPGRAFTWASSAPGVRTVGRHRIDPDPAGRRITLEVEQTGPLAPLMRRLLGAKVRRYVELEAAGLKNAAEAPARTP